MDSHDMTSQANVRPGDDIRALAAEVENPTAAYKTIPAWRERSLVALSGIPDSLWAIQFDVATRDLGLPDPQHAESWDVWQFEESIRGAAALLVGAATELDRRAAMDNQPVAPDAIRDAIANLGMST